MDINNVLLVAFAIVFLTFKGILALIGSILLAQFVHKHFFSTAKGKYKWFIYLAPICASQAAVYFWFADKPELGFIEGLLSGFIFLATVPLITILGTFILAEEISNKFYGRK